MNGLVSTVFFGALDRSLRALRSWNGTRWRSSPARAAPANAGRAGARSTSGIARDERYVGAPAIKVGREGIVSKRLGSPAVRHEAQEEWRQAASSLAYHQAGGCSTGWSDRRQCRWNDSSVQQARELLGGPQNGRPQNPPMKRPATAPGGPAISKPAPPPAMAPIRSARAGRGANETAANTNNARIAFMCFSCSIPLPGFDGMSLPWSWYSVRHKNSLTRCSRVCRAKATRQSRPDVTG